MKTKQLYLFSAKALLFVWLLISGPRLGTEAEPEGNDATSANVHIFGPRTREDDLEKFSINSERNSKLQDKFSHFDQFGGLKNSILKYQDMPKTGKFFGKVFSDPERREIIQMNQEFVSTPKPSANDKFTNEYSSKQVTGGNMAEERPEASDSVRVADEQRQNESEMNSKSGLQENIIFESSNFYQLHCSVDDWPQMTNHDEGRESTETGSNRCCNITTNVADCRGCNLTCIPTDFPTSITQLFLANNKINSDALYEGVFGNYTYLTVLELDSNNITYLPDGVFEGLNNLQNLSLYNNNITFDEEFNNSTVFQPLNNTLHILIINRNTNDKGIRSLVYPDMAFSVLKNLSCLHIDGLLDKSFGDGFVELTKLTNLSLAGYTDGYCNMNILSNYTFKNLPYLQYLNISDCELFGGQVEANALASLNNLQTLDVSSNPYLGIQGVGTLMYGLRDSKQIRRLVMHHVVHRFAPCTVVLKDTLKNFQNTSLEVVEAMNNEIEMIQTGALQMLPKTLRIANLTINRIMFGAYWRDMCELTGLDTLILDGYFHPVDFPNHFPVDFFYCPENDFNSSAESNKQCDCCPEACSNNTNELILPLPPNLTTFSMHGNSLAYTIKNLTFCPNNNLLHVDFSANMFPHLGGPILGLNKLVTLNLSSCFIETIAANFFDNLTTLKYLNLFQNLLGDCLGVDYNGTVFDELGSLTYLNLSFNNLYKLSVDAFKDLNNLETLDLSTNRLAHVNFSVKHMKNLTFIDLHKNDISELPQTFRDHIDELLKTQNVSIDMRQNPIHCDCTNLAFLEWVVRTNIFGKNFTHYYCKYPVENLNSVEMPHGYEETVVTLRRECSTNVGLFLGVVAGTLVVVIAIAGLLLYRFRWTLRYWYHAAKLKFSSNPQPTDENDEFDVFVSYASEDVDFILQELQPRLEARNLKLLIHGEKFKTGRHITDNIYSAVCESRKTLVLVTKSMLTSHWCTYEMQMARMKSIRIGRNVLVFLFLGEVPPSLLNANVISYIKTSTYISYPREAQHREAFWSKLANDLRAP